MTAVSTKINAANKVDKSEMLLRYIFDDNNFKNTISNKSCRIQVLHHALVIEAITVLFIISDKNKLVQFVLIDMLDYHLGIYKSVLNEFKGHLNFPIIAQFLLQRIN